MKNNRALETLKKIDAILLPRDVIKDYSAYIWLLYLPFFFVPVFIFSDRHLDYLLTILSTFIFLLLYFLTYRSNAKKGLVCIAGIIFLGTVMAFITPTACSLFIFAAGFCGRFQNHKHSLSLLAAILCWIAAVSWLFRFDLYFYLPGIVFSLIIGLTNIYYAALAVKNKEIRLSQQEIQRLAKVAERERIARDLHDLIGHTFSVLTLKADLAGRLLDKGLAKHSVEQLNKARDEINQIENISRDALSQVREVVSGYRSSDLLSELANAKHIFSSVDIGFTYEFVGIDESKFSIDNKVNRELAIIMRELVTNILKHAEAKNVNTEIRVEEQQLKIIVHDDGKGMPKTREYETSGFGLQGIRERVHALQGSVDLRSKHEQQGTQIQLSIPFALSVTGA